jgi:hypothetical protein
MNDALREAAAVAPEWARKEQRRWWLIKVVTAGVMISLAAAVISLVIGVHNGTEITQIQHSACQVEPDGKACQQTKREAAKAESVSTACIPFHQAGYPCPKPGSTPAERVTRRQSLRAHPVQAPAEPDRGDATSAPTGHSQSGPRGSGGSGEHGSGGSHHAPAPGKGGSGGAPASEAAPASPPTAPSPSQPPSSTTTERTQSTVVETPPGPVSEGVGKLVEGVGGTVQETGGAVNGSVESVSGTTCSLAKVLC